MIFKLKWSATSSITFSSDVKVCSFIILHQSRRSIGEGKRGKAFNFFISKDI